MKKNIRIGYSETEKIYPASARGKWRKIKSITSFFLLGIYFFTPWIRWDRGEGLPSQAIFADFDAAKIYIFSLEIWPQQIAYLAGFLFLFAITLFFSANVFGRLWCGFLCIQTVWTDMFFAIERYIEGDRNARMRIDKKTISLKFIFLRSVKYSLWMIISVFTGAAWLMYFNDAPTYLNDAINFTMSFKTFAMTMLFSGLTFALAGFVQGKFCRYACPWGRFQSNMFNNDSLLVNYRNWRGSHGAVERKTFQHSTPIV